MTANESSVNPVGLATMGRGAVIVTGAGGGIGQAIVRGLAANRSPVVLVGRDANRVSRVAEQLGDSGAVVVAPADIQDEGAMRDVAELAVAKFGRIDALIACAAAHGPEGLADEIPLDEVAATFAVNVVGTLVSCRAVLPAMRRQAAGNLVLYSSGAGHVIPRREVRSLAYQVSKFAVDGLVNGLAVQLRGTGINVNGIRPGRTLAGANVGRPIPDLRQPEQAVEPTLFLATLRPNELTGFVLEAADYERGYRPTRRDYTLA